MPNKHFCQGPTCHEQTTADRFLKSRGVIREDMHTLIVMLKNIIMELEQINTFVLNDVSMNGYLITWKTLNKVDRLSLSDTDERVVVMKKELLNILITLVSLIKVIQLIGLTTGPK